MPLCPAVGAHSHRYPTVPLLLVNKTECCFALEKAVDVMTNASQGVSLQPRLSTVTGKAQ